MERTVVIINAKNKAEASIALEMAYEAIKTYQNDSNAIFERVCVTNEGNMKRNQGGGNNE